MTLDTLPAAIEWCAARWDRQRTVPLRLHESHTTDGELGAPRFTHSFMGALDGRPDQVVTDTRTQACGHPLLAGTQATRDCPECFGVGIKDVRSDLYRYPMTLALSRLARGLPPRRSYPHPVVAVTTLAEHGWDARSAASSLGLGPDMAEAYLLLCIRRLHSRYQEGPIARVGWVDKSDAQRNAESWTAA